MYELNVLKFGLRSVPETEGFTVLSERYGREPHLRDDVFDFETPSVGIGSGDTHSPFDFDRYDDFVVKSSDINSEANIEPSSPVDDIHVEGERRMTDEEIREILDEYNPITVGPIGMGGGIGYGGINVIPSNLSGYSCADLAYWENQLEENISNGQSFATAALSLNGDFFRGQQAFQEIYNAFSSLEASGQYQHNDPWSNVAAVFVAVREPNGILATTLLGLGLSAGIEYGILSIVETVFRNQSDLDRIKAEQANRGSGCGS